MKWLSQNLGSLEAAKQSVLGMACARLCFPCLVSNQSSMLSLYDLCRYPGGYTLLYIPYYSPDYSGYHWAVYNNDNTFYGFDDGDATLGRTCASSGVASAL